MAHPPALPRAGGPGHGGGEKEAGMSLANILWLVVVVVVALWLIGLLTSVAGNLIHLLLVIALIVIVYNLIVGRRAV